MPKAKDVTTVQFKKPYGTCGVLGPSSKIWAAAPFRVGSGDIVDIPKYLAIRIDRDEPAMLIMEKRDFLPQIFRRKEFNQNTGRFDIVDKERPVKELMKKKKEVGFPRMR